MLGTLLGLTWRPHPPSEEEAFKAMKAALARGCNFWNGGVFYGTPEHNSLTLLNKYFTKYPEDAAKVVLSIKGALKSSRFTSRTSTHEIFLLPLAKAVLICKHGYLIALQPLFEDALRTRFAGSLRPSK